MKFIATKAVDGDRAGPGVFTQAGQVPLHLRHNGARGGGDEGICNGGARNRLYKWEYIPRGLSGPSRRVGGVGETPSVHMGLWGYMNDMCESLQWTPTVSIIDSK